MGAQDEGLLVLFLVSLKTAKLTLNETYGAQKRKYRPQRGLHRKKVEVAESIFQYSYVLK